MVGTVSVLAPGTTFLFASRFDKATQVSSQVVLEVYRPPLQTTEHALSKQNILERSVTLFWFGCGAHPLGSYWDFSYLFLVTSLVYMTLFSFIGPFFQLASVRSPIQCVITSQDYMSSL